MAAGPVGKQRRVLAVILLALVTLGIYGLVWQYKTFAEMKAHSGEGIGGGLALVFAILVGGVPNVFLMPAEAGQLYARAGRDKPVSGLTGFWVLLPLVGGIIWVAKTQGALNRYWAANGAAAQVVG